jgi:uncharacterized peroxidase-related enzyme
MAPSSDAPLSRLRVPDESELPEDIQELFAKCREKLGFVPNVYRAYALRPEQLRGFVALYETLMLGDSGLTKAEREMIAVTVSSINHCHYCLTSHGAALRIRTGDPMLADQVQANFRAADLSPRQRAMCAFAAKLSEASYAASEADIAELRAHGFGDADIWDITQVAAFFNYTNRVANAAGLRPNREFYAMGR